MFQELPLSGVILCYGPLLLVVGGFIAFAYYTDSLARKSYLRNLDPRPDAERPPVTPFTVAQEVATITPAGFKVILAPGTPDAADSPAATTAASSGPDDLRKIEGIGPKMNSILNAAGITTFAQLADYAVSALQEILDEAKVAHITTPETWPEQAALARDGKWDELNVLQDTLDAGRRRKS